MIDKKCKYCGKDFEVYESAKRGITFCSHKCGSLWWGENVRGELHPNWKPRIKRICLACNTEFEILYSKTKRNRGRFCSKECAAKWRGKNIAGENHPNWKPKLKRCCKYCGDVFEVVEGSKWGATFCNMNCYGKWISDNKSGKNSPFWRQIEIKCKECGGIFEVYPARVFKQNRGKFCSKNCLAEWQSKNVVGENHPSWIDGRSFNPYCRKFNNRLKERVRDRDGRVCQLCHISEKENGKKLDVHHIHYDKENCYPDLIALCWKCNIGVNKIDTRGYYEQLFMNNLNARRFLFWIKK